MKLYIAGPMTGIPHHNYPLFNEVEKELVRVGYTALNPARVDEAHSQMEPNCLVCKGSTHGWDWYMRKTIAIMCTADGLALLPNWQESRGARIERDLAHTLKMPTLMWFDWINRAEGVLHAFDKTGKVSLGW